MNPVTPAARVACHAAGPILSTGDIMREEQYHARGMFHEARLFVLGTEPLSQLLVK